MYAVYTGKALFAKVQDYCCALGHCGNCISCTQRVLRDMGNRQEVSWHEVVEEQQPTKPVLFYKPLNLFDLMA